MNYNYGETRTFPLSRQDSPEENVFYIRAFNNNGDEVEVKLPKLEFQRRPDYLAPAELPCRVKGILADGTPFLTHDKNYYTQEFYGTPERLGKTFEFTVQGVTDEGASQMFIRDSYGLIYTVRKPATPMRRGQRVKGKFNFLRNGFMALTLVADDSSNYPYFTEGEIMHALNIKERDRRLILFYLRKLPELAPVLAEIDGHISSWPLTALKILQRYMPQWFMGARDQKRQKLFKSVIGFMRNLGLFLLEGSPFLNFIPDDERRSLQEELTAAVESVKPFKMTLELVGKNMQGEFISSLLDRLQKSGFIYHPSRQFAALMLIFRLYPEEVHTNLDRIFAVIFERKLSNWQLEPFRQAFIEQFDIYVNNTRQQVDALPQVETPEERTQLSNLLTAIALELLIAGHDKKAPVDNHSARLRSLFYRYASLVNAANADTLLGKSFLSLMGDNYFPDAFTYENLKTPMVMIARSSAPIDDDDHDPLSQLRATHSFNNGYAQLTVSPEGLVLGRAGRFNTDSNTAIPAGWMPWLRPQITLEGLAAPGRSAINSLKERAAWWASAGRALLERGGEDAGDATALTNRDIASAIVGDQVYIRLTGTTNDGLKADIIDPNYHPGKGFVPFSEICRFQIRSIDDRLWRHSDGTPRIVRAEVIKDSENTANGTYTFSLVNIIRDYHTQELYENECYLAGITKVMPNNFVSICHEGLGLVLQDPEHLNPRVGTTVKFRLCRNPNGSYGGIIEDFAEDSYFDSTRIVAQLLQRIEEFEPFESDVEEIEEDELSDMEMLRESDEILSREDVRELAQLLRFKAISATELTMAFDYVQYARLLALLAEDHDMANQLATHAQLLRLTQFFAKNDRLDQESLSELADDVKGHPLLENLYRRLMVVDALGNNARNNLLEEIISAPRNELEGLLARLAMSYNYITVSCPEDTSLASGMRQRIKSLLNVNYEQPKSKYYGSESQFVEFKSSAVYKAVRKGEKSVAAADEQRFELLHIMAGFLNSTGGTLYIGVNDRGYAAGLYEDLLHYRQTKAHIGKHYIEIKDAASLALMLENLVDITFGEAISRKISISLDEEARAQGKDVIVVQVQPSYDPVLLNDKLFVRTSTSTRMIPAGPESEAFAREREFQWREMDYNLKKLKETEEAESVREEVPESPSKSTPVREHDVTSPAPEESVDVIETSLWKKHELHDPDIQPAMFLYFNDRGGLESSRVDIWRDTQSDCLLGLAVMDEEMQNDDSLVVAFSNGKVMRFELSQLKANTELARGGVLLCREQGVKPVFAAVVPEAGFMVCYGAERAGTLMRRAVPVRDIELSRPGGDSQIFFNIPAETVAAWDVASAAAAESLSGCLPGKLPRNFGATLRARIDSPESAEIISKNRLELNSKF